ncbi:MAG TPA: SUMF1/EgtB/PvdO family nonheme iron enzyme [Isosphaeraceae bacterium]
MQRSILLAACVGLTTLVTCPATVRAQAGPPVELRRWAGPATLVANRGPGEVDFELVAEATWGREAARDRSLYAIRTTLPDGQIRTRSFPPNEGPGARRLTVLVPAASVRNLRPEQVIVQAVVVDAATGAPLSNTLLGGIAQFPTPEVPGAAIAAGPFGWGRPLEPGGARLLARPGPDELRFVRIAPTGSAPAVFLATTEANNAQVGKRLSGYDPRAGRSDEFALEDPDQPAVNLSAQRAQDYLGALGEADETGVSYRLPTQAEWLRAARADRDSAFWWGDEPTHPEGANFLGPEPALKEDATAPALPYPETVEANAWGLSHTFGNVAEWATGASGGFVRLGGHFRTEPASPLPEVGVEDANTTGPDPYVGVRPAFELSADRGAQLLRDVLRADPRLANVQVAFDPDRVAATLTGEVGDPADRDLADRRLQAVWWLAAVDNQLTAPTVPPGLLATLNPPAGPARRLRPLARVVDAVPVPVRWASPLPVAGTEWYVNVYTPDGGHLAHALVEPRPGTRAVTVLVDRARVPTPGTPLLVALSLGAPAPVSGDPRVVSNVAPIATPP